MELKPGYKQSEVGVIPDDWFVKSIKEVGTPVRGGSPRPAGDARYFDGSHIPWLTVAALTNIPDCQLIVTKTDTFLTAEGSLQSRTLNSGTLIIANSGATLGIAKVLGIQCCANDGVAALLNPSKTISINYVAHFINSKTAYLREVVATGNGQPNLNTELIGNFNIAFPPTKAEQEAIARALGDAEAFIAYLQELIGKKRLVKQGVMDELFRPKEEWVSTSLGCLGTFLKGSGVRKDECQSGDIPCVRYGEIYTTHSDYIKSFNSWISPAVAAKATPLQTGDVLFAGSGETKEEIGKCAAFVDDVDAYAGGDILILRPANAHSMFLGSWIRRLTHSKPSWPRPAKSSRV